MGKTLRVCLAMGGGVSLGSFSGAALTEALKLLVLYGKDEQGKAYDKVVVDGMSGASAGAIALTIMLRCLIDYKSMLRLNYVEVNEQDLESTLISDYFNDSKSDFEKSDKKETLKALELAQHIQYKIWVEEVDALRLYGQKTNKKFKADPNASFSLLDRKHLEDLANKYLIKTGTLNLENRQLLDEKRVVFACSLTNLLPIQINASSSKYNKLEKNVQKSTSSDNHSELRVIDFVFDDEENVATDGRWLRFSAKPQSSDPTHFNIAGQQAWSTIAASALACGAFPIAFEPVLLKRFKKEFGGASRGTSWPKSFLDIQHEIKTYQKNHPEKKLRQNAFFGENSNNVLDYESFNFPYVDGGTFNNEPIREAFRIGTFQDFGKIGSIQDRLVLFVDPIVRKEHYRSFKVSSYSPVKSTENRTVFKNEINKLVGNLSNLVGVLVDQGSIKEEDKILDTKENFSLRETIFDYLDSNQNMSKNLSIRIVSTAFNKVSKNLQDDVISMGTRDTLEYFYQEIQKACAVNSAGPVVCRSINRASLKKLKKAVDHKQIKAIDEVYELLALKSRNDKNVFAQAIFKVITDFSLDTAGKSEKSYKAAIMPINNALQTIELPGSEIEAFGGFASLKSRQYSFEFAKLSTLLSLKEKQGFRVIKNENGKYVGRPYIADARLGSIKDRICSTINAVNFFDDSGHYAQELKTNLFAPSSARFLRLLSEISFLRKSKFFLLQFPLPLTALFGGGAVAFKSLYSAIFKKSSWTGNGFIKNAIQGSSGHVNYIALEPVTLSFLSDKKLKAKLQVKCLDTNKRNRFKLIEHQFDAFGIKTRYQYLFKVALADFIEDKEVQPDEVATTMDAFKASAGVIRKMSLTLSNKVKVPTNIDGNLQPKKKRLAIQQNYDRIIESLTLDKQLLPSIERAINDQTSLLHYSFKNINFHVNPLVEIDLDKLEKGWYFKEQTQSLDKRMLITT